MVLGHDLIHGGLVFHLFFGCRGCWFLSTPYSASVGDAIDAIAMSRPGTDELHRWLWINTYTYHF